LKAALSDEDGFFYKDCPFLDTLSGSYALCLVKANFQAALLSSEQLLFRTAVCKTPITLAGMDFFFTKRLASSAFVIRSDPE